MSARRVGLIGVSGYARVHYDLLVSLVEAGEIEFCAAAVINQNEESEKCRHLVALGVSLFEDYHQMLAQTSLDLCCIPTGIPLHAEMTCAALESGANVLVEKPAAATIQDVDRMSRVAESAERFVAVGYQACYHPLTHELKDRLAAGLIGDVVSLKCRGLWPRDLSYYDRNSWAGCLKQGDVWVLDAPFSNALSHYLNLMLFWAGNGSRLSATATEVTAELYRAREIESADTAAIRVRTVEGPDIHFWVTHSSRDLIDPEIVITGSKGSVTWTPESLVVERSGVEREVSPVGFDEHRLHMIQSVLARLEDPAAFVCDLDIAGRPVVCANAAFESCSIERVAPQYVNQPDTPGGVPAIKGITETIAEAFAQEALFSEIGVPWAIAGRPILTRRYDHFPSHS